MQHIFVTYMSHNCSYFSCKFIYFCSCFVPVFYLFYTESINIDMLQQVMVLDSFSPTRPDPRHRTPIPNNTPDSPEEIQPVGIRTIVRDVRSSRKADTKKPPASKGWRFYPNNLSYYSHLCLRL